MSLLSLHILWDISPPLTGINSCSPGTVSKTLWSPSPFVFKLGRMWHTFPTPNVPKPPTSLSSPWHVVGHEAQAKRRGSAHRHSILSLLKNEGCSHYVQQSSTRILQLAGISHESSTVSYLRQRFIPLNYRCQSQPSSGHCPGRAAFSSEKPHQPNPLGTHNQRETTLKIL